MASEIPRDPETGAYTEDHTLDPSQLQHGQLVYLYGYIPAVAFGTEDDGTVELARFGNIEFHPPTDISSKRGDRPTSALPPTPEPGDRIASLEAQVSELTALLKNFVAGGQSAPQSPEESDAGGGSSDPSQAETPPAPVTPFGTPAA